MRGVPLRCCDIFPGDRSTRRDAIGLAGALGATPSAWPWRWRARHGIRPGPLAAGHRAAVRGIRRAVGLASEGRGEVAALQRRDPD